MNIGYNSRAIFIGQGERPEWHDRANCRGVGPDIFFAEVGHKEMTRAALEYCDGCPVKEQCMLAGLTSDPDAGVWGGETPRQRRTRRTRDGVPADCRWCGKLFVSRKNAAFCTDDCRRKQTTVRTRQAEERRANKRAAA